jgi:hypothetical protein
MMMVPAFSTRSEEFLMTRPSSFGEHSEKRGMFFRWETVDFADAM